MLASLYGDDEEDGDAKSEVGAVTWIMDVADSEGWKVGEETA